MATKQGASLFPRGQVPMRRGWAITKDAAREEDEGEQLLSQTHQTAEAGGTFGSTWPLSLLKQSCLPRTMLFPGETRPAQGGTLPAPMLRSSLGCQRSRGTSQGWQHSMAAGAGSSPRSKDRTSYHPLQPMGSPAGLAQPGPGIVLSRGIAALARNEVWASNEWEKGQVTNGSR